MCNKEHLVGYLYGELSPAERAAFQAHLGGCAECRGEVEGLGQTRQHLASWSPPEPEFNFSVVQTTRKPAPEPRRWLSFVPQWGLAAAAALIVVAGAAAIANVELRYGQDGSVTLRTGWAAPVSAPVQTFAGTSVPGVTPVGLTTVNTGQLQTEVDALRQRLQEIEQALETRAADQTRLADARRAGISASDLRKVLTESEERQRTEMAMHVAQVWKDFNAARASDLARVQQTLMQSQGLTNTQLRQQRETLDSLRYLHTVSQQK